MSILNDFDNLVNNLDSNDDIFSFHANHTIRFGEIIERKIDYGQYSYFSKWSFDNEHRKILNELIENRYYFNEFNSLGGEWRIHYISKMNELILQNIGLLTFIEKDVNFFIQNNGGKSRTVDSMYPQEQLSGNADYATNSIDNEFENWTEPDKQKLYMFFNEKYENPYNKIVSELRTLFTMIKFKEDNIDV